MGSSRFVCHAVALIAVLASSPSYASPYKTTAANGVDLANACSSLHSDDYCAGFIAAANLVNGNRFLTRPCPPAMTRGDAAAVRPVREYLSTHPAKHYQKAADIIFDVRRQTCQPH